MWQSIRLLYQGAMIMQAVATCTPRSTTGAVLASMAWHMPMHAITNANTLVMLPVI